MTWFLRFEMELTGRVISDPRAEPELRKLRSERGRIEALVPLDAKPPGPVPVIAPGFIDAHTHPVSLGLQELFVNLETSGSIDDVLGRLSGWLSLQRAASPQPEAILGFNLEPSHLAEDRYPATEELDRVTTSIPVFARRVDCHSAVTNSAGLRLIASRHPELVELGPVLRGQAYELAVRVFERMLKPDTIRAALEQAADICAAQGVTTFAALVGFDELTEPEWRVLLDALTGLSVRAVPFLQTRNPDLAVDFGLPRVGGCILIDGSFGSHTAALHQSYSDLPEANGVCYLTDQELTAFFSSASGLGLQTAVHAIGDRAVEQVLRCHEKARDQHGNPLRHRVEHAELLNPSLVERIASLELILGVQPAFEAFWGGVQGLYARRLGRRWRSTNPYRSLLDAGVTLAGGSDAPITPVNPIAGIRAALNHPNDSERVSGTEALAMFTTSAAYSLGLERQAGRLEPGFDADFVVLSDDPRSEPDCRVLATYRCGKCVYEARTQTHPPRSTSPQ